MFLNSIWTSRNYNLSNKFIKWFDECLENQKRDFNQCNIAIEETISSLLIKRQLELKNKAKILESFSK